MDHLLLVTETKSGHLDISIACADFDSQSSFDYLLAARSAVGDASFEISSPIAPEMAQTSLAAGRSSAGIYYWAILGALVIVLVSMTTCIM